MNFPTTCGKFKTRHISRECQKDVRWCGFSCTNFAICPYIVTQLNHTHYRLMLHVLECFCHPKTTAEYFGQLNNNACVLLSFIRFRMKTPYYCGTNVTIYIKPDCINPHLIVQNSYYLNLYKSVAMTNKSHTIWPNISKRYHDICTIFWPKAQLYNLWPTAAINGDFYLDMSPVNVWKALKKMKFVVKRKFPPC